MWVGKEEGGRVGIRTARQQPGDGRFGDGKEKMKGHHDKAATTMHRLPTSHCARNPIYIPELLGPGGSNTLMRVGSPLFFRNPRSGCWSFGELRYF